MQHNLRICNRGLWDSGAVEFKQEMVIVVDVANVVSVQLWSQRAHLTHDEVTERMCM